MEEIDITASRLHDIVVVRNLSAYLTCAFHFLQRLAKTQGAAKKHVSVLSIMQCAPLPPGTQRSISTCYQNKKMPHIHIVIPVWNQWHLTKDCLTHLAAYFPQNTATKLTASVTVVDDGSTDSPPNDLVARGKALFNGAFSVTSHSRNKGFAAACNTGAATAPQTLMVAPEEQFLFFLNNDVCLTEGWHAPLLAALQDNAHLGAVSPLLVYPEDTPAASEPASQDAPPSNNPLLRVQHCGYSFTPSLRAVHLFSNLPLSHPAVQQPRKLQAISAAAMLIRSPLFQQCGGFYESFCNGMEDIDLCARMLQHDKHVDIVHTCHAYHTEGVTRRVHESCTPDHEGTPREASTPHKTELNRILLNERTKGVFGPDLHHFTSQAGLYLRITPWLESYYTLTPEKEEALTQPLLEQFSPAYCWRNIQEEPLWFTGYELLCAYLEQHGMLSEACGVRLLQSTHFPMLPVYTALAETARTTGNTGLAEQAQSKIAHTNKLLEDPGQLIKKAAGMVNWAKKAKEPHIQRLFEEWLQDLGML